MICLNTAILRLQPDTPGSGIASIVQIYHNGQWGTVCHYAYDSYWDMNAAKVACCILWF
jgi:hypothetical protein